jgi:hypothetical protein
MPPSWKRSLFLIPVILDSDVEDIWYKLKTLLLDTAKEVHVYGTSKSHQWRQKTDSFSSNLIHSYRWHKGKCQSHGERPALVQTPSAWFSSCWLSVPLFPCSPSMPQALTHIHPDRVPLQLLVISVEQFPRYTSLKHIWQCFQHYDKEQRTEDRSLVYSNSHTEFFAVLTIDMHSASYISIHSLNDLNSPSSMPRLFKAYHSTFLGIRVN